MCSAAVLDMEKCNSWVWAAESVAVRHSRCGRQLGRCVCQGLAGNPFERGVACRCSVNSRERGPKGRRPRRRLLARWNQAPVGLDAGHHERTLRVEAHHDGSVQRIGQVAGYVEQENCTTRRVLTPQDAKIGDASCQRKRQSYREGVRD